MRQTVTKILVTIGALLSASPALAAVVDSSPLAGMDGACLLDGTTVNAGSNDPSAFKSVYFATLDGPMHYAYLREGHCLTIYVAEGVTVDPHRFRLRVVGLADIAGHISGDGPGAVGWHPGSPSTVGVNGISWYYGMNGGQGYPGQGYDGAGIYDHSCIGVAGVRGGAGLHPGGNPGQCWTPLAMDGGVPQTGAVLTANAGKFWNRSILYYSNKWSFYKPSAGSGGGGGDGVHRGGGAGAAGSLLVIEAGSLHVWPTGRVSADGGPGGDADPLCTGPCGGGPGGSGGVIYNLVDPANVQIDDPTTAFSVAPGPGGQGMNGGENGLAGNPGVVRGPMAN